MGIAQISTSVTIINSLNGFIGVSLTNYETSALSAIAAGSVVEVGGAFFICQSETAINASSWSAIASAANAYLALTPSGTAGSQIITPSWVADEPAWSESKQGWYTSAGSIIRVIGSAYKVSATQQETKTLYVKGRDKIFQKKINIGVWNMDADSILDVIIPIKTFLSVTAFICRDDSAVWNNLEGADSSGDTTNGTITFQPTSKNVHLQRTISGDFDGTSYNDVIMNRGYVLVTYEA